MFVEERFGERRLWQSTLMSTAIYAGVIALVAVLGKMIPKEVLEAPLEVVFRAPPPQAAPPPPATAKPHQAARKPTPTQALIAPKEVSDSKLEETTAKEVEATADNTGEGAMHAAPPAPAVVHARDPVQLPENGTPPVADASNAQPEYPDAARTHGLEGQVILKIVVDDRGNVTRVDVMKGDEPFVAAAVAAVKRWHYAPALADGAPISVFRIVKIPFRLRG